MKRKLISLLKYCRPFYLVYYHLCSWLLRLVRILVRTDERLILFNSFGGKAFNDSPRVVYDAMLTDQRFDGCRLVWAFQNPEAYTLPRGEKIRCDSPAYFVTALKARCWVTNSSLERGLGFRGKHTYFVNTWHGTPVKKMGTDIRADNTSFRSRNPWNMDLLTTQSEYESQIFTRAFGLKEGVCQMTGLPRNDELVRADHRVQERCRGKLGIPMNHQVILYAPTFREYEKDRTMQCLFDPPTDFTRWTRELGPDTWVLVRAHYETVRSGPAAVVPHVLDVSDYPYINDLMIASDVLVSDYSSVFVDYAILGRPMVCFAYDYERYERERGMYFDIRDWLDWGASEDEVIGILGNLRDEQFAAASREKTVRFRERFVQCSGTAAAQVLDRIAAGGILLNGYE